MALANKRTRQFAFLFLKLSVSAVLCYVLFSRIGGSAILRSIMSVTPWAFGAAVALYVLAMYLSSVRWRVLIPEQMKTRKLFDLYTIGSFFNMFLPGIVGGDAVKAYYLSRELKARNQDRSGGAESGQSRSPLLIHENVLAIASVFMDRYIGFFALLVINVVALVWGFHSVEGTPLGWVIPLLFVSFISCSAFFLKFRVGNRLRFLLNIYDYFQFYRSRKDVLLKAFLYSLGVQILGIVSVYVLAKGISLEVSFLALLIFVPVIILTSLLPVSISGIGLREGAFVLLLGTIAVPAQESLTLSLLWFLSVLFANLWGLVEYLRYKTPFVAGPQK